MRLVLALSLLGAATCVVAAACTAPTVEGSLIESNHALPNRSTSGDDDDGAATAPTTTTTPPPPTVTAKPDAGTPSKACAIASAALCFTFEGNTTNQSADGFQPSVATGIAFAAGHENEAASFTSLSALQFPANTALELPAGAATIEAWINRQATGGDAVVFDDDGRFSLTIRVDGTMICKSSGGAVAGTTVVSVGAWNHVACVVEGTTLSAYLNGHLEGSGTGAIQSAPTLTASIGANAPPGSAEGDQIFLGLIDSFRLLTVARSATDIAADAAGP